MENIIKENFNVKELAVYLGVSPQLVYKLKNNGELKYFKVGRKILFNKEKVDLWINNQEINSFQNEQNPTGVKNITR